MKTLMEAMAAEEGFYKAGTRPQRNNNPGDIDWSDFAHAHGATRQEVGAFGRFAYFPTVELGFACMKALLSVPAVFRMNADGTVWRWPGTQQRFIERGYLGATIAEALFHWAPPSDGNNVSAYLAGVLEMTGLQAGTLVAECLG